MKRKVKLLVVSIIILFFATLIILDIPERIIHVFGEEHAYIALFLIAAVGGVSTFTAASYFGAVVAFASAGLNPFLLGVAGGLGVTIGDSLFFLFGNNSRAVIPEKVEFWMTKIRSKLERFNQWSVPLFVYIYAAFTPFPNEFMTISVGMTGAKYRIVAPALLLGNITITAITALLVQGVSGYSPL